MAVDEEGVASRLPARPAHQTLAASPDWRVVRALDWEPDSHREELAVLTTVEQQRIRENLHLSAFSCSTYHWRAYFQYLLGRPVTLEETDTFLRAEGHTEPKGVPA